MTGQYDFGSKEEIVQSFVVKKGKIYSNGQEIPIAAKGEKGDPGLQGNTGLAPEHEWMGGGRVEIRFKNPDGSWGQWENIRGLAGLNGRDGRDGEDGRNGTNGTDGKDAVGKPGKNGIDGKDGVGTPGKDGQDGKDGKNGAPGVEPEDMKVIRIDLGLMNDSIKRMFERLAKMEERLANVKDGKDGKDGSPGRNGESKQGYPGIQGDKGEPGIPPHDWNITLNNVAELMQQMQSVIMEFRNQGVEI